MRSLRFAQAWQFGGFALLIAAFVTLMASPDSRVLPPSEHDKLAHAVGFFGLTLWFTGVYARSAFGWLALGMLAFGALTEVAQATLTARTGDPADLLADGVGVAAALGAAMLGLDRWTHWLERWLSRR